MPADIQLYYANTPNGQKIPILLEELGNIPYDRHYIDFAKKDQFSPEFLAINPNNKIPAIVDLNAPGLKEPLKVFESVAILQYLAGTKVKSDLYPEDVAARAHTNEWLYFQISGLGPQLGQYFHFAFNEQKIPYAIERFETEVKRLFGVMEKRLSEVEYFNGHGFSIADIALYPWIHRYPKLAEYPHVKAWATKVGERPGVQKGLKMSERP